jgi:tetratricopeptide (TPR) repeat protein
MILYRQGRYALAATEFGKELEQDPKSAMALSMLALAMTFDRRGKAAIEPALAAIALDPERAFCHYALAVAIIGPAPIFRAFGFDKMYYRLRVRKGRRAAMQAMQLDPTNPDYYRLLAGIELDLRRPRRALKWADQGLALQPNHIGCANLRAKALTRLGRSREAKAAVRHALSLDPNNSESHKTGGWTHLKAGQTNLAIEHFTESVRLNPEDQQAQIGLKMARTRTKRVATISIVVILYFASRIVSNLNQSDDNDKPTAPNLLFSFPHPRPKPNPTTASADPVTPSQPMPTTSAPDTLWPWTPLPFAPDVPGGGPSSTTHP